MVNRHPHHVSFHITSSDDYYSYSSTEEEFEPEKLFPLVYPEKSQRCQRNLPLYHSNSAPNVFDSSTYQEPPPPQISQLEGTPSDLSLILKQNPNSNIYYCTRKNRAHIHSRILFSLTTENNNPIFYAKTRGTKVDSVFISDSENIHIRKKLFKYILFVYDHSKRFVLRPSNSIEDLMIITMDNDYGHEYGPRKINIYWPKDHLRHVSKIANKTQTGKWSLNSGSTFPTDSSRNAIILDEYVNPSILIRKSEHHILELDVSRKYKPIYIFALAIASFLCTI